MNYRIQMTEESRREAYKVIEELGFTEGRTEMNETDGIRKMAQEARQQIRPTRKPEFYEIVVPMPEHEAIKALADAVDRICDILDNTATTDSIPQ